MDGIIWVDGPPKIEFLDDGVLATFFSDRKPILKLRSSRGEYRKSLEQEMRRLNEFEEARRKDCVLPLRACPHQVRVCEKGEH